MHNDNLVREAIGYYEDMMNSFVNQSNSDTSFLELKRKHSSAKFEAIDYFIKKCTFEVNPWKLEKEIREKYEDIRDGFKRDRKYSLSPSASP